MPSNLSIVSSDVPSDAQPITMTAGDDILKDQLVVFTPSRKVYPASPSQGQAYLTRVVDTPVQVSAVTISKVTGVSQAYNQGQTDRSYVTPDGNVVVFGYDGESPRNYSWNLFAPDGTRLNQAVYTTTNQDVAPRARKVDANRFMVIWINDGNGSEQNTYRYIIYNNDGSVSQALTTVVLNGNAPRTATSSSSIFDTEFMATSDGHIVGAFNVGANYFNLVSWSLAGVVKAIAFQIGASQGVKPELVESFGATICKVIENGVSSARVYKFNHSIAGVAAPTLIGNFSSSSFARNGVSSLVAMKNGNVIVCDRFGTVNQLFMWDGTNFNNLPLPVSATNTSSPILSIHDLGDGEAMAFMPTNISGSFYAIRINQTGKMRASGLVNITLLGGGDNGYEFPRFFKTPDSILFTFADYNASGTPVGWFLRAATLPLSWPLGGETLASLGTIVNLSVNPAFQYKQHIDYYAQGEIRSLVNAENGTYPAQIRTLNARRAALLGVAAAAATKDSFVTLKTKGAFTLPAAQDFGEGFSFGASTQGVVGTGGKVVGRNAVLAGLNA